MDDGGTEHERGWLRVEDGLIAEVHGGEAPGGRRGSRRRGRHPRLREHAPPPVPDPDARTSAAGRPLHVAEDALPGLGAHRRRDGVRGGAVRPGRARALGLLHRLRPSLRLPARRRRGSSRPRSAPHRSSACASSRRAARWISASPTAACRPTRSSRTSTRSSPTPNGCTASRDGAMVQIAVAPCSPFSVTTRLMEESATLARRLGLQLHTHLAETIEEDAYCRELFDCTPVEYLERVGWIADDVWCAHCVHLSDADVATFGRAGVGVAHCPTSNLRLGAGVAPVRAHARCPRAGRARSRRQRVERTQRHLRRREERAARRARPRRRRGADRARRAPARDARRRRGAAPRRHRARSQRASAPTSPSGARTASSSAAPRISSRTSSSAARTASTGSWSAARTSCAAARSCAPTSRRSRAEHRKQARRLWQG